jgi:hypothetical protein
MLTTKKNVSSSDVMLKTRNSILAKANKTFYLKENYFLRQLKFKTLFFYASVRTKEQYQKITWVSNQSKLFTNYLFFKARMNKQLYIGGTRVNSRLWLPGLLSNYKALEKIKRTGWSDPFWTIEKLNAQNSINIPLDGYPVASSNLFTPRKPSFLLSWTSRVATHEILNTPNAKIAFISPWESENTVAAKKKTEEFNKNLLLIQQNKMLSTWCFNFIEEIVEQKKNKLHFLISPKSLRFSFHQTKQLKKHLLKLQRTADFNKNNKNVKWLKIKKKTSFYSCFKLLAFYKKQFFKTYAFRYSTSYHLPKNFFTKMALFYLKKNKNKVFVKIKKNILKELSINTLRKTIQNKNLMPLKKKNISLNINNFYKKKTKTVPSKLFFSTPRKTQKSNKRYQKHSVPDVFLPVKKDKKKTLFNSTKVEEPMSFEQSLKKLTEISQLRNRVVKYPNKSKRKFSTFSSNKHKSLVKIILSSPKANTIEKTSLNLTDFLKTKNNVDKSHFQLPILSSKILTKNKNPVFNKKYAAIFFVLNQKKKQFKTLYKIKNSYYNYLKKLVQKCKPTRPLNKKFGPNLRFNTSSNVLFLKKKYLLLAQKKWLNNYKLKLQYIRFFLARTEKLENLGRQKQVWLSHIQKPIFVPKQEITVLSTFNKEHNNKLKNFEKKNFYNVKAGFFDFLKTNFISFVFLATQRQLSINRGNNINKLLSKKKLWINIFKNSSTNKIKLIYFKNNKTLSKKIKKNAARIKQRQFYLLENYRKKKRKRLFGYEAKLRQYFARNWRQRFTKNDFFLTYNAWLPLQRLKIKIKNFQKRNRFLLNNFDQKSIFFSLKKKICLYQNKKSLTKNNKKYWKIKNKNKWNFIISPPNHLNYINSNLKSLASLIGKKYRNDFKISNGFYHKKTLINPFFFELFKIFRNYKYNKIFSYFKTLATEKQKQNNVDLFLSWIFSSRAQHKQQKRRKWYRSGWKRYFKLISTSKNQFEKKKTKNKKIKKLFLSLLKKNISQLSNFSFSKWNVGKKKFFMSYTKKNKTKNNLICKKEKSLIFYKNNSSGLTNNHIKSLFGPKNFFLNKQKIKHNIIKKNKLKAVFYTNTKYKKIIKNYFYYTRFFFLASQKKKQKEYFVNSKFLVNKKKITFFQLLRIQRDKKNQNWWKKRRLVNRILKQEKKIKKWKREKRYAFFILNTFKKLKYRRHKWWNRFRSARRVKNYYKWVKWTKQRKQPHFITYESKNEKNLLSAWLVKKKINDIKTPLTNFLSFYNKLLKNSTRRFIKNRTPLKIIHEFYQLPYSKNKVVNTTKTKKKVLNKKGKRVSVKNIKIRPYALQQALLKNYQIGCFYSHFFKQKRNTRVWNKKFYNKNRETIYFSNFRRFKQKFKKRLFKNRKRRKKLFRSKRQWNRKKKREERATKRTTRNKWDESLGSKLWVKKILTKKKWLQPGWWFMARKFSRKQKKTTFRKNKNTLNKTKPSFFKKKLFKNFKH